MMHALSELLGRMQELFTSQDAKNGHPYLNHAADIPRKNHQYVKNVREEMANTSRVRWIEKFFDMQSLDRFGVTADKLSLRERRALYRIMIESMEEVLFSQENDQAQDH
ncbi:hypothetical protein [Paracraurococcus lichenis]|uniref:Uncharacterized protein n=1 Tax=Paracraurococcus lichenis TaxID=3064888 RepID=A0ABT9EB75_9PROT|nr:hypothetical protein [Paracraurococcus sp. LOR1-02]MDO9713455.1 hypothetical protein [Paracraurococcus sp. LOR1-02]